MGASIRVLHVDADAAVTEAVASALEGPDDRFVVETATETDAGLDRLTETEIDCVVTGYDLPDRTGVEFVEAIRAAYPYLPCILYAREGSEAIASDAITAGVTDYLRTDDEREGHRALADRIRDAVETALTTGQTTTEAEFETADGSQGPDEVAGTRLTDANGEPTGRVGVGRESSDRTDRERALRERTQELRAVLDGVDAPIWIRDADSRFELMNRDFRDLFGIDHDRPVTGKHPSDLFPPAVAAKFSENDDRVIDADGRIELEETYETEQGTRTFLTRLTPLYDDGELSAICGVATDITDRKERERQLSVKDQAMNAAPVGIVLTDPSREDNPIVYANRHFESMTGYDESEIVGRNCRFLQGEATASESIAEMREAIDRAEPVTVELRNYRADGSEFWNRVTIAPVVDDGSVSNFVGFQQNVTDRVESERMLDRLHEQAQRLVEADGIEEIGGITAGTVTDLLECPAALYHYDRAANVLEPVGTGGPVVAADAIEPGDGRYWDSFVRGERRLVDAGSGDELPITPDRPVETVGVFVLADHGLLVVTTADPDGFDDRDLEAVETACADACSAFERTRRERELQQRETRITEQTDQLRRFQDRNDRLRKTGRRLLAAETRSEAESILVEELASMPACEAVGLFRAGVRESDVSLLAAGGDGTDFFDAVQTDRFEGTVPSARVVEQDATVTIPELGARLREGDWQRSALGRDFRSVLSVALSADGIRYGVMTIFANETDPFDDDSVRLFEEFGTTVARVFSLIESRNALQSGYDVEVELTIGSMSAPLSTLADRIDSTVAVEDVTVRTAAIGGVGGIATACSADRFREAADAIEWIDRVASLARSEDGLRFELLGTVETGLRRVVRHGASVRSLTVDPNRSDGHRLRLAFPSETIVNQSIEFLLDHYDDAELTARRPTGAAARTSIDSVTEELPRDHLRVLEAAHERGYFDRPRETSGEAIATELGLSSSTFHRRLRAAQRTIVAQLFSR